MDKGRNVVITRLESMNWNSTMKAGDDSISQNAVIRFLVRRRFNVLSIHVESPTQMNTSLSTHMLVCTGKRFCCRSFSLPSFCRATTQDAAKLEIFRKACMWINLFLECINKKCWGVARKHNWNLDNINCEKGKKCLSNGRTGSDDGDEHEEAKMKIKC